MSKHFHILTKAQEAKLGCDLESATYNLYHAVCQFRSRKVIGQLIARVSHIQRKLVASDILKKGKQPTFKA